MADHQGFEPYHVPQQSRRDKLRFLPGQHQPHPVNHLFDPTSSPEFLACAGSSNSNSVKEEHHNLMSNYLTNSSKFRPPQPYLDHHRPQPSNFHDINLMTNLNNSFHYNYEQPLSLSLSSNPSEVVHHNPSSYGGYSGTMTPDVGPIPVGPFTGYASVLKGSRFLKPAQQLLEDLCDVGSSSRDVYAAAVSSVTKADASSILDDAPPTIEGLEDPAGGDVDGGENRRRKSCLISMLDEVYRRYKQYYHQMQAVITSFEYVAGLGNAAPYANLAIKAMTRHFKCLKNAIINQLQYSRSSNRNSTSTLYASRDKDEATLTRGGMYGHRSLQRAEFGEQPVWRPQRGLPERAVTVLRSWLFEHFLHPYPTDTDKVSLAKQTGISRSQVSNWFINARVRLWKPMVEEIHMLETRQAHRNSDRASDDHDLLHSANSVASENPSTSTYRARDAASKRPRNDFPDVTVAASNHQLNMSYNSLPSHLHHVGQVVGGSMAGGSASGVSLTLGLHHQNNGIGLSEPPYAIINTPQRFGLGLEGNRDGYAMGGFDSQDRHFGRDVLG